MAIYTFGEFRLDEENRVLQRNGTAVPLTGKVFSTLVVLVKNQGRVMQKDQLLSVLWPDAVVEEANLTQNVSTLRKALGDNAKDNRFIATIAGRGYSFIAPVVELPKADPPTVPEQRTKVGLRPPHWFAGTALIIAVAAIAGWMFVGKQGRGHDMPEPRIIPFTTYPGLELMPAFSPDGKQIAYVRGDEGAAYVGLWKPLRGHSSIYTKLVGPGTELRLTNSLATDSYPAWSPDGQFIAFARRGPGVSGYYVVSALGGPERRITAVADDVCAGIAWTPDGKTLMTSEMSERSRASPLAAVSIETGARRTLTSPGQEVLADINPAFSPDGRWLAFIRMTEKSADIQVIPEKGGALRTLTSAGDWKEQIAWTADSRAIIFSTGVLVKRLWRIPLAGGAPVAVTSADHSSSMPAVAGSGERLAYVVAGNSVNLWRIDLPVLGPGGARNVKMLASTRTQKDPHYSEDGSKIVFETDRSGFPELWVSDAEGRNPTQLTHMEGYAGSPKWAPDGSAIAFDWNGGIWKIRSDGGAPQRITTSPGNGVVPSWSRDGKWIYFASSRSGEFQIWKTSSAGESSAQPAVPVTTGGGFHAMESLDGKYLYFSKGRGKPGLWRRALGDNSSGAEELIFPLQNWGWWTLVSNGIYFFEEQDEAVSLKHFDPARKTTRVLYRLPAQVISASPALTASFDGRHVVYAQIDPGSSDIMLVENFH